MISPFLQGSKNLLKLWKDVRASCTTDKNDHDHLQIVNNFWSMAPTSTRVLDWDDCSTWPDAWLLMHSNEFDESAISLGMFYTLLLTDDERWTPDRCVLQLIKDDIHSQQKIVLKIDDLWLMNYEYKKIIAFNDVKNDFYTQQIYYFDGKIHTIKI